MLINEVIHIVGLSRKSIRYYESVGLLSPTRNKNNSYRIYTEEDINKLKIIKFLRDLDVPIKDLQLLNENKLTLEECMIDRINKINDYEEKINKTKNICNEIIQSKETFNDIKIDAYSKEINKLNKEGFTMKSINKNHTKKILGAILSSSIFIIFLTIFISTITFFQTHEQEKMPWILFIIIIILLLSFIITILTNLITRIKEIKGGEEDEASKY